MAAGDLRALVQASFGAVARGAGIRGGITRLMGEGVGSYSREVPQQPWTQADLDALLSADSRTFASLFSKLNGLQLPRIMAAGGPTTCPVVPSCRMLGSPG